ncbi:MAG: LPS assembly lipoprotein LptE [Planctomycetota bacterium]|nr:LPS assembly lipoprotein LptE [Planctomycetota bacterium]MDP6940733.1 LPS assembly lipoprotein LptE [Planctomycetota bacterium]
MIRAALFLWIAATISSCGYKLLEPGVGAGATISVPPSENPTRWRGAEVSFTSALRKDLQRLLHLRFSSENPDYILRSSIQEIRRGAPVRSKIGGAIVGTATVVLTWTLENSHGETFSGGSLEQTLEYLPSEDEDEKQAIEEILDWMAESVVIKVHADFTSVANDKNG